MANNEKKVWITLRILGSGGFGQVTLWQNSQTGEKIGKLFQDENSGMKFQWYFSQNTKTFHFAAIKKLHELDHPLKNKQLERWCNEVEIMKKLKHANVVAALELPSELDPLTTLPILAMEYCSLGDLRQVLNRPENCCGLKENEILNILRDVSNGLAYLHSCKIIHRDLKPENIVLQEKNLHTVYKLIDLGYAKAFDQTSLSKSFVGTIQYIAPELFMGKLYTSSVDYWSFGLLAHEIINGYRPFLPDFNPSDWMKKIQNKERKIINVLENTNGTIEFSSTISKKNHLSGCYIKEIEIWLQVALDWNGQSRGRDIENNRLIIFENLSKIINKKVIKVFSMITYAILSYEISMKTDISNLRAWLKNDTDLDIENQLLLLPTGKSLEMKGNILNCLKNEKLSENIITLFLYNQGKIWVNNEIGVLPYFNVKMGSRKCSQKSFSYKHLKRNLADLIYCLQMEATKYNCFLQGIKVKIRSIKEKFLVVNNLHNQIKDEWIRVENFGQFLYESHKVDLENYIHHRKTSNIKSCELVQKWIKNVIDVNRKMVELKTLCERGRQKQMILFVERRSRYLENSASANIFGQTFFNEMVNDGIKLWEDLQNLENNENEASFLYLNVLNLTSAYTVKTKNFMCDEPLKALILEIADIEESLIKLSQHFAFLLKCLKVLKLIIGNTQRERQTEIWNFIKQIRFFNNVKENNDSKLVNKVEEKPKNWIQQLENEEQHFYFFFNVKSKIENESILFQDNVGGNSNLINMENEFKNTNTFEIIEENNQLRHRVQEVQNLFRQRIKELCFLD